MTAVHEIPILEALSMHYSFKLNLGNTKRRSKNGLCCFSKQVKVKREFHPIDPQAENVIELSRYYTTLKKDSNYKKGYLC